MQRSPKSLSCRAGSSVRLVRLKPQGPGPDMGPDRPVQRKFTKQDHFGPEISREKEGNSNKRTKVSIVSMYEGPAVAFMPQGPEGP